MITQNIHVRMDAYGIPPVIHAVEGDTWRYLDIYTDDAAINTSNTAAVAIHRPDNSYYTISATPDVSGFYHLEMDQALTRPGKVECQLKVSSGDLVISTYTFYVIVEPSTTGLPTEQLGYDIYDLIDAAQQIQNVGLTEEIKQALLDCFEHVAWTDEHGQDYVDALEAALYPPANLVSISAVYTQSGTVYDTDTLDSLKEDLVVTAHYDDFSTQTVTDYTLSGTLTEGTSTITVSYGGKTTTFTVTVTEYPSYSITYNLTNVTSSNDAVKVSQGGSYTTTLSYDDTQYVLRSVAVTMGGTDVTSTVYSGGQILIQEVTGAVVITAVAGEPIINATALKNAGAALAWYSDDGTTRLANQYYAKYGCTTETCIADSTAEIRITNNTDAAIPAQAYYIGQASDFSNRQNVVANYAVSKGSTALAVGETLTFTYDIKKGNRLLFSAFENATISVRNVVVGEYVPDDADGSAYEVVAQNTGGNCYYYSDAGETQLSGSYENNHIKTSHSFDTDTDLIIVFDGPANAEGVFGSQHDTNHIYYCTNTGVSYWMGTDGFCVREMTVKAGCPFAIKVAANTDNLNGIKVYKKKSA